MAEQVVVKKRGRPRKVGTASSSTDSGTAPDPVEKTAKTVKPASKSTTAEPSSMKRATRKALDMQSSISDTPKATQQSSPITKPTKRKASKIPKTKASIVEQANAFHTDAVIDDIERSDVEVMSTTEPIASSEASSPATSTTPDAPRETSQSFSMSSFLDDDYKEPIPEPTEASVFSDRSAFGKSSAPSIEDIIRGDGVTSLGSLSLTEQAATRDRFKPGSTAVHKPVKTFQGYGLGEFPDKAQSRMVKPERLNIPPETYGSQSFRALKKHLPLSAMSSSDPTRLAAIPPNSPTTATIEAAAHKAFSTTSEAAARSRSSQPSTQPRFPIRDLHDPQSPTPLPPAATNPSSITSSRIQNLFVPVKQAQAAQTGALNTPPAPPPVSSPSTITRPQARTSPSRVQPQLQPPKPTQMTPQQLLRNPQFKSKRRQYLGLIVGIPVALATSLEVYRRFGGASFITDEPGVLRVEGVKARRGELPQGGLLGDGGLKGDRSD